MLALELHAGFFQHADRARVVGRDDGENALETEHAMAVLEYGGRSLECVALAAKLRQERIAHVGVRQRVALDQSAHPRRLARVALLDAIHAEAEALVHVERPLAQVATRAVEVVHVLVADEAQPGRIIDQVGK